MAKRDPEKTQRNKVIAKMTAKLKALLPRVLLETGISDELSLHGKFGGKNAQFIDIKNEVIQSPDHFVALWMEGYMTFLEELRDAHGDNAKTSKYYENFLLLKRHRALMKYVILFLMRTYLREFEALSKHRPTVEDATLWIGPERGTYGLLVAPRFRNGQWENDKSEIRHFPKAYWTIGHILHTGLVVPFDNERIIFHDVEQYLSFFKNTLVRASGSPHEKAIAERYCEHVRSASDPEKCPLLIPEFRYGGLDKNHQYRLDFCVIHSYQRSKVGFELSPWSTHGRMTGIKDKTQTEINRIAQENFEHEVRKLKSFFRKHGIVILVYTDSDLKHPDTVFKEIEKYLAPTQPTDQLRFMIRNDFMEFDI